jgi:hypothetical protein
MKKLVRCEQGHFYDGAKYSECPHCCNTKQPNETVYVGREYSNVTADLGAPKEDEVAVTNASEQEKNEFTVHCFRKSIGTEPVVGWLVCIKGVHYGEDFKIKSGRNFIGRSSNNHICLSADTRVSRDSQAILTYDAKSNQFFIQPDNSSELCYLNDEPVLSPTKLNANDEIALGESKLKFVPFCSDYFVWEED